MTGGVRASAFGVRRPASGVRVGVAALFVVVLAGACDRETRRESTIAEGPLGAVECPRNELHATLDSIGRRSGGTMSVSFVDVRTNERFDMRGDAPVFMASVMKLPLAVQLLARVDAGELRLSDTVRVAREQLSLGRTPLSMRYPDGFAMTVDSLLRYAVSESDNTAADALLRYGGGPRRATAELQRLGIHGIRIDRDYLRLGWDLFGGEPLPVEAPLTKARVDGVRAATLAAPDATHDSLSRAFATQPEDRATTRALADLLARISRGELLSEASRQRLLSLMTGSGNPAGRIVAGAPADARVAHKTGTWSDWNDVFTVIGDVGIVRYPDNHDIVVAIMIADARTEEPTAEAAIADATRAILADLDRCRAR